MAAATLAVGIGAATSLYAVLRAVLSTSSTQIEDVSRLARIYVSNPGTGADRESVTLGEFRTSLSDARSFEAMAAWTSSDMSVGSIDGDVVSVTAVSPQYFSVLRARAVTGRLFSGRDFVNGPPVALVNDLVWRRRLGARPIADGLVISLGGVDRTVVGIVSTAYELPLIGVGGDAWIPMPTSESAAATPVSVIGRVKPGVTWTTATAELSARTPSAALESPWHWRVIPVDEDLRYRSMAGTAATLLPALVVLLTGCVNVACMLLARGLARAAEFSVRMALGASRSDIVRQLLLENLVLAVTSGLAGFAISVGVLRLITSSSYAAVKPALAAHLAGDLALLPIAGVSTALACLLFGTIPAIRMSRPDTSLLKGVRPSSRVRVGGYGGRDLIVFVELGFAVVLLAITALWLSFFNAWQQVTVAFAADDLIAVPVASRHWRDVVDRVSALPTVEATSLASDVPGERSSPARVRATSGRLAAAGVIAIDRAFFTTTALPLVRGREFSAPESAATAPVAIVSERVVRALWPDADPIGQTIDVTERGTTARVTVIGVSRDAVTRATAGLQLGSVYRPLNAAESAQYTLLVRTRTTDAILRMVATAARESGSTLQPRAIALGAALRRPPQESVGLIRLFGGFSLMALLLAGSGIYGVIRQSVTQRTTEFGVRLALGATPGQVLRMVLTREGKLIVAALAAGSIGTIAVTKTVFAELVSTAVANPAWPIALMSICGGVAALSCALATFRIVRLNPWTVLRQS